tara:strand:+ start:1528 stop:1716 length:189 start_codon:yes stop_codon:yes gene_type:complete
MIKNKKKLQSLAKNVANVTLEIMYENTDWMLSDYEQDGDEFNKLHDYVMQEAIKIMYKQTNK